VTGTRVVWSGSREVRFDLSHAERSALVERLRELHNQIEARKEAFAAEKKEAEREKARILDAAANGYEYRDVPCEQYADDDRLVMVTVRLDTGDVLDERAMTAAERQAQLGLS
jgi:hypothetical protein